MIYERASIFTQHAKPAGDGKNATVPCLTSHAQIPLLMDTLCKRQQYHLLLIESNAKNFNDALIETFVHQLSIENSPKILQSAEKIFFDVTAFFLNGETQDNVENDFHMLCDNAHKNNKGIIFIVNQLELFIPDHAHLSACLVTLGKCLQSRLNDKQWRFIILTDEITYRNHSHYFLLKNFFTPIKLNEPTENESLAILKNYRSLLEDFHQVTIAEETVSAAIALANIYLSGNAVLDNASQLLDAGAVRAKSLLLSHAFDEKPIVTTMHLAQVVSNWTQIPLTHLQNNKFQASKMVDALQRRIFGQNAAIQMVGSLLQNGCVKLYKKSAPLCSFLIAGPSCVGKRSLAYALAEYLFSHHQALLRVNTFQTIQGPADIMVTMGEGDKQCLRLLSAIQKIPYSVVLFEHIDLCSNEMHDVIKNIILRGYLIDENEKKYNFHHAIVIMTTRVGADKIIQAVQAVPETNKQIDLMQLVLNENISNHSSSHDKFPMQGMKKEIYSELIHYFSEDVVHNVNVIPFLPLDYISLEKIIGHQLKTFVKHLDVSFNIELSYAPEVIQFLAQEVLSQQEQLKSVDALLEQYVYSCVSSAILHQMEDKNKSKRLLLQLNDNGQLLRCEIAPSNETTYSFMS